MLPRDKDICWKDGSACTYKTQYQVTFKQVGLDASADMAVVTGDIDSPVQSISISFGDFDKTYWADKDTQVDFTYAATVTSSTAGKQFVRTGVSMTSPQTVTGALEITGTYQIQYELTMATNFGTTSPAVGGGHWYSAGTLVTIRATAPAAGTGEAYAWNGWTGTGTGSYTGAVNPSSVTMSGPITETALWIKSTVTVNTTSQQYSDLVTFTATLTPDSVGGTPPGYQCYIQDWVTDNGGNSC